MVLNSPRSRLSEIELLADPRILVSLNSRRFRMQKTLCFQSQSFSVAHHCPMLADPPATRRFKCQRSTRTLILKRSRLTIRLPLTEQTRPVNPTSRPLDGTTVRETLVSQEAESGSSCLGCWTGTPAHRKSSGELQRKLRGCSTSKGRKSRPSSVLSE